MNDQIPAAPEPGRCPGCHRLNLLTAQQCVWCNTEMMGAITLKQTRRVPRVALATGALVLAALAFGGTAMYRAAELEEPPALAHLPAASSGMDKAALPPKISPPKQQAKPVQPAPIALPPVLTPQYQPGTSGHRHRIRIKRVMHRRRQIVSSPEAPSTEAPSSAMSGALDACGPEDHLDTPKRFFSYYSCAIRAAPSVDKLNTLIGSMQVSSAIWKDQLNEAAASGNQGRAYSARGMSLMTGYLASAGKARLQGDQAQCERDIASAQSQAQMLDL